MTLVAADETVRAALAGVGDELAELRRVAEPADERVVLRRAELPELRDAVLREPVLGEVLLRDVVLRLAVLRVERPDVVRPDADFAAVPRADVLAPAAVVLDRAGREALVLPEFAGFR